MSQKKVKPKTKVKVISSYFHLNKKYNLNFSDNNFGFTWEIFKEFVTDEWALFYTSNCFYKWAPTARKTFKTWGWLAFDLFICCNFSDASMLEIRRYENTHPDTTIADLINVCDTLNEKYGIDLSPSNENGIQWKITKDGGYVLFPNNQRIDFIGYANGNRIFGKAAAGSSFFAARTDEIVMSEERETLTDKQLDKRYTRLQDSLFRSNRLKISQEPIKEWSWTFTDKNELSPTYGQKLTRYFHKWPAVVFTCNPYDKSHYFYKNYVTPFLPLDNVVRTSLKKTGIVWIEDNILFEDLGLFITRFTVQPFWEKLPFITKKLLLALKEKDSAEYETAFYGFEYADDDATQFPFRRALKKIKNYNLDDFKNQKGLYEFDFYSVGLDWATGSSDYTIAVVLGFKEIAKTGYYAPYFICELAAAPNDFIDENDKIAQFIEEFKAINDNFVGFENTIYHYDHNAETAINVISKGLIDKYDIWIKFNKAIKHESSLNKDAGTQNRTGWFNSLLSSGFFYWNKEDTPITFEMIEELRFSELKTNLPDPKMLQDGYDALFYATYPYNAVISNKNNKLGKKTLFIGA